MTERTQWRSLFLPLKVEEEAVYATFFDASSKVLVVKSDACLVTYSLTDRSKGPHPLTCHVPTTARHNLCPTEAKAVCATSWTQPHLNPADGKKHRVPHPATRTLHGAVGMDSGHILLFWSGGYSAGFCAKKKCKGGIVAIESVLGYYRLAAAAEMAAHESSEGFDDALTASTAGTGDHIVSSYGSINVNDNDREPISRQRVPAASLASYSPAEGRSTPSESAVSDESQATTGGVATVARGVVGLVVGSGDGFVLVFRRSHPWDLFLPSTVYDPQSVVGRAPPTNSPANNGAGETANGDSFPAIVRPTFFKKAQPFTVSEEVIFHAGIGRCNMIYAVDVAGREVEKVRELPGFMERTTAMASDGPLLCIARDKVVFSIHYSQKITRRLFTLEHEVVLMRVNRPLGVLACANGAIVIFGSEDGKVLSTTYTYNFTRPISIEVDWSLLSVAVIDSTFAVELLEMPAKIRRYGLNSFALKQALVLRRLINWEEDGRGRAADNEEQLILARLTVPEECLTYLSKRSRLL